MPTIGRTLRAKEAVRVVMEVAGSRSSDSKKTKTATTALVPTRVLCVQRTTKDAVNFDHINKTFGYVGVILEPVASKTVRKLTRYIGCHAIRKWAACLVHSQQYQRRHTAIPSTPGSITRWLIQKTEG